MCENQGGERSDDVKMVHSQHARILKEEDEIWISSEDLNTENSSDDDKSKSKHTHNKRKVKLKHRKRSSPCINVQRVIASGSSSVPGTSSTLDERLLMPKGDNHPSRSDESRTSDEECGPRFTQSLSKRLSLEDWRPMKGALNISSLEEAAAGDTGTMTETENFYDVMFYKLRSLKSCPVLKSPRKVASDGKETLEIREKTFKLLKRTPEVEEQLDFINEMDEELVNAISKYKVERSERMKLATEVCKHISEHKLSQEKNTENFLKMCKFEEHLKQFEEHAIHDCSVVYNKEPDHTRPAAIIEATREKQACEMQKRSLDIKESNSFIRRNIWGARQGMMAVCSLTDEEKGKIEKILQDIDDFKLDDGEMPLSSSRTMEQAGTCQSPDDETENILGTNAFVLPDFDKLRMGEIDKALEKIFVDKSGSEQQQPPQNLGHPVKNDEFWKQYTLDQTLKDIDTKLAKLTQSYIDDEETLKIIKAKNPEDADV